MGSLQGDQVLRVVKHLRVQVLLGRVSAPLVGRQHGEEHLLFFAVLNVCLVQVVDASWPALEIALGVRQVHVPLGVLQHLPCLVLQHLNLVGDQLQLAAANGLLVCTYCASAMRPDGLCIFVLKEERRCTMSAASTAGGAGGMCGAVCGTPGQAHTHNAC